MARTPKPWKWEERGAYYATVNGVRHRLSTTERKAQTALKELLEQRRSHHDIPSGQVIEILDRFLRFFEKRKKSEETYLWYKKHLDSFGSFIEPDLTTADLRTHHVQDWMDSHNGWADGTKHGAWRAVNRCFRWATRQGFMPKNPAEDVEKPSPPRREVVIPVEHYRKMLELTNDQNFRDLITVAWECGPRPQELLPMRVRHLELQNGRAMFPRDEAKGKKRPRYVYFTAAALEVIHRLVTQRRNNPNAHVFVNTHGLPWTPYSAGCRFARMKQKIGVRYCLYHFRHTWQDKLLKSRIDPITVATLAGHVDASMLARVYQHLSQDADYLRNALSRASAASGASDGTKETSASADKS